MNTHRLNKFAVDRLISDNDIGAYALGHMVQGSFELKYAGRSDNNLRTRLMKHIRNSKYTHFAFWKRSTIFGSFHKECELWHKFASLDNQIHPDAPRRLPYHCPFCLTKNNFKIVTQEAM